MIRTLASVVMTLAVCLIPAGRALALDPVRFSLSWVPTGRDAGFYVALDKGYYQEEGLDVTILKGSGSGDTVKRVAIGTEEFGFADATSVVVGRAQGLKVRLVGMIHDTSLFALYALKTSGIRTPKDLEGKRIGSPPRSATRTVFPAFAGANGVDLGRIEWVDMTAEAMAPSLLARRVDAVLMFANEFPTLRAAAARERQEVVGLLFSDYGVDVYSNGLIAADRTIQERPDLVRRFVHASMKGVAWAVERPQDAAHTFVKHNPVSSEGLALEVWSIAIQHLVTPATRRSGLGAMAREKMEATRNLIAKYESLPAAVPIEELYTNDFVPKIFPK